MVQWFCLISWIFDIWTSYFVIMSQYDSTLDLKINVSHCDLYFMVQWFCLISWRLFDIWTPYFGIMSQYDLMFDLKIFVGHCDLYFMVQWICLISWKLFSGCTSYFGIMSEFWPLNMSICHGPVTAFYLKCIIFVGWMSYLWKMCQCNTTFNLKIKLGHNDLYFIVHWFLFFYIFCSEKHFSFIGKAWFRRATLSCEIT